MGFFDLLNQAINGSDEEQPKNTADQSAAEAANESAIVKGRDSSFPLVYIKRLKPHVNGAKMQLYCHIVSDWPEEIEIDKIRIFDTKRELDTTLRPREEREFLVYDGPVLTREYHEAELVYKTRKEGDYFQTVHTITFAYNATDKTYLPSDAHVDGPVRDIFG